MEIKVFWKSGEGCARVDSHQVPEYVGRTQTHTDEDGKVDTTECDASLVLDVVESLSVTPEEGAVLSRRLSISPMASKLIDRSPMPGNVKVRIVSPGDLDRVERIEADGEQVWPELEEEDVSEDLGKLQEVVSQLTGRGDL